MNSRRSNGTKVALPPAARIRSSVSSRPPTVRPVKTRWAPSRASRSATAAPMPREAPVISAILPARRAVIRPLASGGRGRQARLRTRPPLDCDQRGEAEQRGKHQVIARRQAVAGLRDQPGRDQRREAAKDRYRDAVAERHADRSGRSEEHTSELQSLAYLVCRLLLEK